MDVDNLVDTILEWLKREGISLNTLAGAVVVLDKLRLRAPLTESDVFTGGGQLIGGRGKNLRATLLRYGIKQNFLSDGVTTRSTNKFRNLLLTVANGDSLSTYSDQQRALVVELLIAPLAKIIEETTQRPALEIDLSTHRSLTAQIQDVLMALRPRSRGRAEQHLVGAKLETRFPEQNVNRLRTYAADVQTERTGDFVIHHSVYHITASPTDALVDKLKNNLYGGLQPILIVPRLALARAFDLIREFQLSDQVIIFALEDFLAQNILEMADSQGKSHQEMLQLVLATYNQRIEEVETDQSLRLVITKSTSD